MDIVILLLFFTLFQLPILLIVYFIPKLWKEEAIPKPNKGICEVGTCKARAFQSGNDIPSDRNRKCSYKTGSRGNSKAS